MWDEEEAEVFKREVPKCKGWIFNQTRIKLQFYQWRFTIMNNTKSNLAVVIMAGGAGTRFWPLSTAEFPKQFIPLFEGESLLRKSFQRVQGVVPPERIFCLTSAAFVSVAEQQLPELPRNNVIGEPERKDTAAAVCLSALLIRKRLGDAVIVTLTADHLIEPIENFQQTILSAADGAAESGTLYTFGIQPTWPATGYGYLELGEKIMETGKTTHHQVASFREKPDSATARHYCESGNYLWNSGMFTWRADSVLQEFKNHLPNHLDLLKPAVEADQTENWQEALKSAFTGLERNSVDYAIMEKAADVRCAAGEFTWRDMGGWQAMRDLLPRDRDGNWTQGHLHGLDSSDNLVFCVDPRETVGLIGVQGLAVVRAGDRTLVVPQDRLEEIKQLVEAMENQKS